jgi:hypothetical protein
VQLVPTGDDGAMKRLALLADLIDRADKVIAATCAGRIRPIFDLAKVRVE